MTVSRKEILPETTINLVDIECEVDKQLKKPETIDMIKKYGVAVVSVFGLNIGNLSIYDFSQKYVKLGWTVDYYSFDNVLVFFFE